MISSRPYLLRALYQWIVDNEMTPYLLVNAQMKNVMVPTEHVEDGRIILNIGSGTVEKLSMGDKEVTFSARFSELFFSVYLPISSILAIYSKENGQGMMFHEEEIADSEPKGSDHAAQQRPNVHLRVVK